jgi:dehydrogenase/reductase SDR family member 7B
MNYKNQTVWITGASSGIGESMAYAFAKQGSKLILSGRDVAALERVKNNCQGASSVDVVRLDLANHEELYKIADEVLQKHGQIDILVNNAGISQRSLAKETVFAVDKLLVDVNLLGTIALTKAVLPSMLERKNGSIVVVSSLMGKFGAPMRSTYAAAKHGLHGFFDALRAECFQENLRVLMVCPGFVKTNISINSVVADGSKQGTMDDATGKGLHPDVVAQKVLKALASGKDEIYVGGKELLGVYLKRFFPALLNKMVRTAKVT